MEPPQFTPPGDQPPNMSSNYPRPGAQQWGMYPPGVYFEFIGRAWSMIQAALGSWVINSVVFIIVVVVGSVINRVLTDTLNPLDPVAIQNGDMGALGMYYMKALIIGLPFGFLYTGGFNGMMLSALDQSQGRPVSVRIFEGFKNFPMLFATTILMYLVTYVCMAACCLPLFIVPPLFAFAPFFCSQEGLSPLEAMKKSMTIVKPFWLSFAGIYLLAAIAAFGGLLIVCVGIIFTLPIFAIVMALQLQVLTPSMAVEPSNLGPQPPAANPGG